MKIGRPGNDRARDAKKTLNLTTNNIYLPMDKILEYCLLFLGFCVGIMSISITLIALKTVFVGF